MEHRLDFKPGIDTETTATASRGGWTAANLIRWRSGFAEKLRGWQHVTTQAMTGVCRVLHFWVDLSSRPWIGAGTNSNLYVENGGQIYDITPAAGFTPGTVSSNSNPGALLIWSADNFGEIGIFCPSKQGIFMWQPAVGPPKATQIATAPPCNQGVLVTMPQQIIMAYGSSLDAATVIDPLLVRWSSQTDLTDWTPSVTNQAGSFRLPRGNRIIGALQAGIATYLWTDLELWSAQYIGFPLVFGFFSQGTSCGLIAQNAACSLGTTIYWMGEHGFFLTTGTGFQQIPCSVWDFVYLDLDMLNADKCFAATDYHYREVMFFFPSLSGGTGEIDSFVSYNTMENVWSTGELVRTAWTDQNANNFPIGIDAAGIFQQHDTGFDDDGAPMTGVSITSGYLDISDGSDIGLLTRIIPDALWEGGSPTFSINILVRNFPGDTPTTFGPFVVTPTTNYVSIGQLTPFAALGARGREIAIQVTCDTIDSWFRLGTFRSRIQTDGRF